MPNLLKKDATAIPNATNLLFGKKNINYEYVTQKKAFFTIFSNQFNAMYSKKNILLFFFILLAIRLTSQNTPGDNFDLTRWKLQTLKEIDSSYTEAKPIGNHTNRFFYTDDSNGAMVFEVPSNGGKTSENTSYPRVELRQFYGDTNWPLADTNEHYLTANFSVHEVYEEKPKLIIGQIHGSESNSELLKIRWTGYEDGKCYVEARFQNNDPDGAEYGVKLAEGLSLGDEVNYTVTMLEGLVTVTINEKTASQLYTSEFYGTTDGYYFKAGNYIQWNQDMVGENIVSGVTKFYELSLENETLTNTNINIDNAFKIYPNPAKNYVLLDSYLISQSKNTIVKILDSNGRIVKQDLLTNDALANKKTYQMDLDNLKSGVYFIKIKSDQELETQKIIIR